MNGNGNLLFSKSLHNAASPFAVTSSNRVIFAAWLASMLAWQVLSVPLFGLLASAVRPLFFSMNLKA